MKETMCGIVKALNGPGGLVYRTDLPVPQIGDDEVGRKRIQSARHALHGGIEALQVDCDVCTLFHLLEE